MVTGEGEPRDTWVVVPLYQEAAVVGDVVRELRAVFPRVVCVDDGSRDGSAGVARAAGARVVRHCINLGQGAALQTGFDFVLRDPAARFAVTFDADGQHTVADARAMVQRLRDGEADVVFGSRFLDGRTAVAPVRRAVLRSAVAWTNLTTGVRLTDAHNGLRALSREALTRVRLTHHRMAHASEIVSKVGSARLRWVEHPVEIRYTDYSRAKGQSLLNSVNILVETILG
ncbi:glycosyltransferase family 2 protein [Kineococcus indalonis]|uniref:glycosyltransferase family 2 protein n=1 Tax=Kineococcus indalonis TaxID=2696566 RepID=UPI001412BB68|nr:glycosyltransferase family 2 protein [Kineococcus indalonis]NAZ86050.1 glycosyltransferase [Kineococcus indalonis]